MTYYIHFKTPDAVQATLDDAFPPNEKYETEEAESEAIDGRAALKKQLDKFIQYGENVTLEFDSDKNTMTVV